MQKTVDEIKNIANKAANEAHNEKKKRIVVAVTTESILYSVARDLIMVGIWTAGAVINRVTLDSGLISFIMSMMVLIYIISRCHDMWNNRTVRGSTIEETCEKLAERLRKEDFR